ncbi:porin [Paucibacter sp. KBW04]|uniref:porin n=1 Tax=Paucibacter sp. KBW04 TaxID=2153361 RepID=UPI000F56DF1D|nr:porin [Paucibacter sp. KBW04]RQO55996.1 porin [Paucibacter sp. KBW04]
MKKTSIVRLAALGTLGTLSLAATAQSSVTLWGTVDANVRYSDANGQNTTRLGTDGKDSSTVGLRGWEDLGGGLKAGFWLEHRFNPDDGSINSSGRQWHGRSSISLAGNFGELRLGRFTTPSYDNYLDYDAFNGNGVGAVTTLHSDLGSKVETMSRTDNTVAYYMPTTQGGFFGNVSMAAGEGADGKKYAGARLGWSQGAAKVSASYGETNTLNSKYKQTSIGGSYDFGVVKTMASVSENKFQDLKQNIYTIGAHMPVSAHGTIRASYAMVDGNAAAENAMYGDSKQLTLGYLYDMSKRTALYSSVSHMTNTKASLATGDLAVLPGGSSTALEMGIVHRF